MAPPLRRPCRTRRERTCPWQPRLAAHHRPGPPACGVGHRPVHRGRPRRAGGRDRVPPSRSRSPSRGSTANCGSRTARRWPGASGRRGVPGAAAPCSSSDSTAVRCGDRDARARQPWTWRSRHECGIARGGDAARTDGPDGTAAPCSGAPPGSPGHRASRDAGALRRARALAQTRAGDAGRFRQPRRHGRPHVHPQPLRPARLLRAHCRTGCAARAVRVAPGVRARRRGAHAGGHRRRQHPPRRHLHARPAVRRRRCGPGCRPRVHAGVAAHHAARALG